MEPAPPPPLAYAVGHRRRSARRWLGVAVLTVAGVGLLATVAAEVTLRVGPTRSATFTGKRMARGFDYRVSYAYDDGGRTASDTDHVTREFYSASQRGTPLRVRTFGAGTFRFARLAGASSRRANRTSALQWGALVGLGVGWTTPLWFKVRRARAGRRR